MLSRIFHTSTHHLVGKLAELRIGAEAREMEQVCAVVVMPESEGKVVPYLFVEAGGCYLCD